MEGLCNKLFLTITYAIAVVNHRSLTLFHCVCICSVSLFKILSSLIFMSVIPVFLILCLHLWLWFLDFWMWYLPIALFSAWFDYDSALCIWSVCLWTLINCLTASATSPAWFVTSSHQNFWHTLMYFFFFFGLFKHEQCLTIPYC